MAPIVTRLRPESRPISQHEVKILKFLIAILGQMNFVLFNFY